MPVILPVSGNKVCVQVLIEFTVLRIEIEIAEAPVLQPLRLYVDRGDRLELTDLADRLFWEDLDSLYQDTNTLFAGFCATEVKFGILQESFRETSDELGVGGREVEVCLLEIETVAGGDSVIENQV
jgi:hypothetical protein